ncbi:MAG TPA: Crp/Fnr family transcriptional regulator [Telmatospirillum sp.]|nr:Crp/Fnr family transcriptional regulator [Telmatospirillum sp.]
MNDFKDILSILRTNSWFRDLPDVLTDPILLASSVRTFAAGDVIHSQGDQSLGLYAVLSGTVKVSSLSAEGKECVFRYLSPGSWFGEIGMLDKSVRTHDAVAIGETTLLVLPPRELTRILDAHPILYKFLSLLLCRVVRTAFTMLNDTTLLSVSARLAKRLASFAEAYGQPTEKGILITIHLPQDELAMLISTTRQTINKRLADWQRLGWIEVRYGKIEILNMDALLQLYRDA